MKSSDIRQAFLNYFTSHQHHLVSSSPLVPQNDPTLLFTNAGMVQFKDTFLGVEPRPYQRAVSAQLCMRAGGKHNDLENVGYTARHHTCFEMLGNFSFGDYFKAEAIRYAWTFLTTILKLPPERLWVTVYKDDEEAASIWLNEIKVSPERFSRCGEKDNFWSMGETGPCGPCTEIFYDHGESVAGGPPGSENEDGDRYIEIWNLVFMQYNRDASGHLHSLPKPSVDTGMGLERIAAVVQGVHNNYEIDSFQHIIQALIALVGTVEPSHPSLKVIADHSRACAFLIADGVIPGNEGRSYVLRRIIRRAVRHGHKLGLSSPFLYQLMPALIEVMGDAYPQLIEKKALICKLLTQEEQQFSRTLEQGLNLLQQTIQSLKGTIIPGEIAFKLYDTYGFPVDLTADIAREHGLEVEMQAFQKAMAHQRQQSQSTHHFQADYSPVFTLKENSIFTGYEKDELLTTVSALVVDGQEVNQLMVGKTAAVVLKETPFYAESGGQIGDKGQLLAERSVFRVDDTQKVGKAIVHYGELVSGELCAGQEITAQVDSHRRQAVRLHHTATHLLHAALKKVLGEHVQQKGSLVDAERARFDFAHFSALTAAQLTQVESLVNDKIRENAPVSTVVMSIEKAKQVGAVALFGEKYDEEVRVLSIGDFSKELCGGTHASRSGDLGLFKIIAEYGVASGVRRIEMVAGAAALEWVNQQLHVISEMAQRLKSPPERVLDKLMQMLNDNKQQEKELAKLQSMVVAQTSKTLLNELQQVGSVQLLVKRLDTMDGQQLRNTLDGLKAQIKDAVIILYSHDDIKIQVVAGVSPSIIHHVPGATEFVRHLCGKGGGRADMAQGGGPIPSDLAHRLEQLPAMIKK